MSNTNYIPVSNFEPAVSKFENLYGYEVPEEVLTHWKQYNLGQIKEVTFYGLSATVSKHHNLLMGLPSIRGLPNFPARAIPIFDKAGKIYSYDTVSKNGVAYDMVTGEVEILNMALSDMVESALDDTKPSFEHDVSIPEEKLNRICRFIKNEFEQKDRTYVLSVAIAYSLEVDMYSDNVLAYYGDYHSERVSSALCSINERALLDLAGAIELTRNVYIARCEMIRTVPSTVAEHIKEQDEKLLAKTRQLSSFFKELAR